MFRSFDVSALDDRVGQILKGKLGRGVSKEKRAKEANKYLEMLTGRRQSYVSAANRKDSFQRASVSQ